MRPTPAASLPVAVVLMLAGCGHENASDTSGTDDKPALETSLVTLAPAVTPIPTTPRVTYPSAAASRSNAAALTGFVRAYTAHYPRQAGELGPDAIVAGGQAICRGRAQDERLSVLIGDASRLFRVDRATARDVVELAETEACG